MASILSDVGWVQRVIVNRTTGCVVDGHLRVSLALDRGDQTPVPVVYVELSEAEEAEVLATLDPIAAMAATDDQKLRDLLDGIDAEDEAVRELLDSMGESRGGASINVLEVASAKNPRFHVSIIGELQGQPSVLDRLREHLEELPGVEVQIAVSELT